LLTAARKAGLDGCSGLGMLVEQAALAFECWTTSLKITCVTGGPRLAMYRVAAKLG
jgi:shikimate 5-dehydrogenase